MDIHRTLGARVKARRKELKMTQPELAKLAGIKQPSLSEIETGETKLVKGDTLMRLAAALQMNPEFLRTGKGNPAPGIDPNVDEAEVLSIFRQMKKHPGVQSAWVDAGHALLRAIQPKPKAAAGTAKPDAQRQPA